MHVGGSPRECRHLGSLSRLRALRLCLDRSTSVAQTNTLENVKTAFLQPPSGMEWTTFRSRSRWSDTRGLLCNMSTAKPCLASRLVINPCAVNPSPLNGPSSCTVLHQRPSFLNIRCFQPAGSPAYYAPGSSPGDWSSVSRCGRFSWTGAKPGFENGSGVWAQKKVNTHADSHSASVAGRTQTSFLSSGSQ